MYFHEAIARSLSDQGITDIFGVLGDANLFMMEYFDRETGGSFYSVAHEAAGVLAAYGYAQTTGRLGVASVTHGGGLTNTVSALIECVKDRTPLLLLAGDTPVADRDNWQSIPQRDVIVATGAGFEQVRTPATVAEDVVTAIRRAWLERRPVVLNVPVDFQWTEVEYEPVSPRFVGIQSPAPDPAALEAAVGVLASSRRPVVLAGLGATSTRARASLLTLAERLGAPVATTLRAKDLFRGEPFDLGISGTLSHEVGLEALNQSDCIIAFGASLNIMTTAHGSFESGKHIVHVDVNPESIGRYTYATVGVVGDAATVADQLVALLDEAELPPTGFASPRLSAALAGRSDSDFVDQSGDGTVDIRSVLLRVDEVFPEEHTLVTDAGRFVMHCFARAHVPHPSAYVHAVNYACVGLGLGTAIGAAVGAPHRPTLVYCGDGGMMMGGLSEFNTAVRLGLDLVVVVLNDGSYGAEHRHLRLREMDPSISLFVWPEFAPLADALGGQGFTVRSLSELDDALEAIVTRSGPVLIDVKLDPDKVAFVGM